MSLPDIFELTRRPLNLSDSPTGSELNAFGLMDGVRTVLDFRVEHQQEDFWCWSAVAVSILRFLRGEFKSQCELARDVFNGTVDCCQDGEACDVVMPLERALKSAGVYNGKSGTIKEVAIAAQLSAQLPIGCAIRWYIDSTAHFVVLYGLTTESDGTTWVAVDDPKHGQWNGRYEEFKTSYLDGKGRWVASYFTA